MDGITVPAGLDDEIVKSYIVLKCGLLTPVYSDPETFKLALQLWFNSHQWNIQHLIDMNAEEYNPIHNFDRHEDYKEETARGLNRSLLRTTESEMNRTTSGTEQNSTTGHTENLTSAFNESDYQPDNETEIENSGSGSNSGSEDVSDTGTLSDTGKEDETVIHTTDNHLYGNIGITTTQQMMNEEIELMKKYNIYDVIASMVESALFICVY